MPRPRKHIVSVGDVFERLTVIEVLDECAHDGALLATCLCVCGNTKVINAGRLCRGGVKSCGCLSPETAGNTHKSHGMFGHPLYNTWLNMVHRCYDTKRKNYKSYGGLGVTVHEGWRDDPKAFITWIESNIGQKPDGKTLDRINPFGNYEPGNLRWATRAEQDQNTRRNYERAA